MTPHSDARLHLAKAIEFLDAAQTNLDAGHVNAATSDAVVSGINSKDAICLKLTGRTGKSVNHGTAVDELRGAGRAASDLAPTLSRLLTMKTKSQYMSISVAPADAANAVGWAERLLNGAKRIVAG